MVQAHWSKKKRLLALVAVWELRWAFKNGGQKLRFGHCLSWYLHIYGMYCNNSRVTTVYFHDTQVSALRSLLIEGFRHIRSHNRRLVDYSPQRPGTLCRKNGRSRSQSDDEFRHWYGMTTKSTERRGEFEFYLIVKAHTPVVTFSMAM